MKKILINALPMTVVGTGIGRYLRGLSQACEIGCRDSVRLSYFVGNGIADTPPLEQGVRWRERVGQLLWKMPHPIAYGARLFRHATIERNFSRACSGFDVYHEAGYFPLKTREPVRTVLTVHDLSLLRFPEWHPRERVRYFEKYFRDRLGLAGGFCAVSEFTKREMVEHLSIPPQKIHVTPLGYDDALFNDTADPDALAFLEKAGVPEKFIVFVGSGDPRKNRDLALAALHAATTEMPLVTVGWSGWHQTGQGNTINLGYVSDRLLAELYRRAQLLLMPSEYEGFGLPVLEAMACGCPVVTSRAEALLEVGGDAVESVPDVRDSRVFGGLIDSLIGSPERLEIMAENGKRRALLFSWSRMGIATVSAWSGGVA